MLSCFHRNKSAVQRFLARIDSKYKFPSFSEDEWNQMRDLTEILEPLANATEMIQGRDVLISYILPIYERIKRALQVIFNLLCFHFSFF